MADLIDRDEIIIKLSEIIDYYKHDKLTNGLTALFQVCDAILDCKTVAAHEDYKCCPICGAKIDMDIREKTNE